MKKFIIYSLLAIGLSGLLGIGVASAHGWFGHFSDATPAEMAQQQETMFQNKAELLGISVDEMKEAWSQGKDIREIAEEQGISQEQLQEKMRANAQQRLQERLQAMVDNGVISQEQANQRSQFMEERMTNNEMDKGFHKGFGRGWNENN